MPMRYELVMPASRQVDDVKAADPDLLAIVCFCGLGLAATLLLGLSAVSFDQIPLLIMQYNLG